MLVGALLLCLPLTAPGATAVHGAVAALFTVALPFAWVLWLTRRGRVTDHWVGVRRHRAPVFLAAAASMAAGAAVLLALGAHTPAQVLAGHAVGALVAVATAGG